MITIEQLFILLAFICLIITVLSKFSEFAPPNDEHQRHDDDNDFTGLY